MKKITLLAVAGLMAASFAAPVLAAGSDDAFQKADANNDGFVSMDEAMGQFPTLTQTLFDQADANKDGKLDAGEYAALQGLTAGVQTNAETSNASSNASSSQ